MDVSELFRIAKEQGYKFIDLANEIGATREELTDYLCDDTLGTEDVNKLVQMLGIKNPSKVFF